MYERFTDRARKIMELADGQAQRLNHEYISTDHILLGLIEEGSGVAANVLKNLDVDLGKIRIEIEQLAQRGPDVISTGRLPQTPRAKQVIEYSMEEARDLNHNYVGTEHILLGLLREQEGVAAQVLKHHFGLTVETVRKEVLNLLGPGLPEQKTGLIGGDLVSETEVQHETLNTSPLRQLAAWFAGQCNDDWEHRHGIKIETCDNPGWWVTIPLMETPLAGAHFKPQRVSVDENDSPTSARWLCCRIKNNVWHGAGDPTRLEEIVNVFLTWAKSQLPQKQ